VYGGGERSAQGFGRETWGDPDVDGRIIFKMDLEEVGGGCGDWMKQAQYTDRWRALVSTVMNFRVL
jgi:hypothetical protein